MIQRISERQRRPARSRSIAYDRPGWFFVTVVTRHRQLFFGDIVGGVEWLNAGGIAVEQCWLDLSTRFPAIRLDDFILMPNHLHGIIVLEPPAQGELLPSLSAIVGAFKSLSTRAWNHGVTTEGWEPYYQHLWQRSFHDQLIHSDDHLATVRAYIAHNPANWLADEEHPATPRIDSQP